MMIKASHGDAGDFADVGYGKIIHAFLLQKLCRSRDDPGFYLSCPLSARCFKFNIAFHLRSCLFLNITYDTVIMIQKYERRVNKNENNTRMRSN